MENEPRPKKSPFPALTGKGAEGIRTACETKQAEILPDVKGSVGGRGAGGCTRAAGAPPPPSALPCRNSNNCAEVSPKKGYKLRQSVVTFKGAIGSAARERKVLTSKPKEGEGLDREGRNWHFVEGESGVLECLFGGISSAEAKRAFALRQNVEAFTEHYAHEKCGFLTLTPEDGRMSPKEFAEAFHRMTRHDLTWLRSYVRVLEAQKRGAVHWHLCVATPYDLNPAGFDWEALKGASEARRAGDINKARELTKKYEIGRAHV